MTRKFKIPLFLICMLFSIYAFSKNIVFYSKNIKVSAMGLHAPDSATFPDPGPAIFNIKDSLIYYKVISEPGVHVYAISGIDRAGDQTVYTARHRQETIRVTYAPKKGKFSIEFVEKDIVMGGDFANIPQDYSRYIKEVKPAGINTDSLYRDLLLSTGPADPGNK